MVTLKGGGALQHTALQPPAQQRPQQEPCLVGQGKVVGSEGRYLFVHFFVTEIVFNLFFVFSHRKGAQENTKN